MPPAPTLPAAPPVPGIKPTPLFTPVNSPAKPLLTGKDDADADADDASEDAKEGSDTAPADDEPDADDDSEEATDRAPVRLPTPGVWGKQAPHDAVIDFARREDAADFFSKASASAAEDAAGDAHAPEEIKSEDTQALIASMAEEIEEVAEAQKAAEEAERARKAKEAALLEQPTIIYDKKRKSGESDSKMGWIGIAAAALAGVVLIGWSVAGGDDEGDDAKQTQAAEPAAAVAAAERPEPGQAAEPVEKAAPVPVPIPVPVMADGATEGEEAAEESDGEAEEAVEEPAEEPAPKPAPTPTENKKRGPSKKNSAKQTTTTTTSSNAGPEASNKPKPPPSKSAADLLRDAKKANAAGQSSKAYSLASQSYQKKGTSDAAEVMVLAACKMKNTGKARSALNKVKLLKRRDLKQRCKSMGVKL